MFSKLRNYFRKYDNTKKVISPKMKIHLVDVGESMVKYAQEDAERELEEYRRKGLVKLVDKP